MRVCKSALAKLNFSNRPSLDKSTPNFLDLLPQIAFIQMNTVHTRSFHMLLYICERVLNNNARVHSHTHVYFVVFCLRNETFELLLR